MDIQDKIKEAYDSVMLNRHEYQKNESYVKGKNWRILAKGEKKEPDNRVPVAFAKLFVNTISGYAGSDIKVSYPPLDQSDETTETTAYQQRLNDFQDYNDDNVLLSELYKEIISQEKAYLLFWVSDEKGFEKGMMTPEYAMIPCNRGTMIYDGSIKPKKVAFVLFTEEEIAGEKTVYADVYYPGFSEGYKRAGDGAYSRLIDRDTTYPYQEVPAIEFKMSMEGGPVFEAEKELMDQIDKVISRSNDELERFANVTLLLPNELDKGTADKLRTAVLTMLDDLGHIDGDKWPRYLEKNLSGVSEYQNNILTTMKDYMFKTIGIPDMMDERFGSGDESGVARAFKLISLEYQCSTIDRYFKKALYERKALFDDIIEASTDSAMLAESQLATVDVTMERNLPMDMANKAQVAGALKAIISDRTIFEKILGGIVDSPEEEMERLAKQKENEPDLFGDTEEDILEDVDDEPEYAQDVE